MIALLVGMALAVVAGASLVSLGRPTGLVESAVGTGIVTAGLLVAIAFALSPVSALDRWWLLAVLALGAAIAVAVARRHGSLPRPDPAVVADVLRDRAVLVLGGVVVVELAYVLALALFTPQNDGDAIHYHLTRPALWRQEGGVGLVEGTADTRMNAFPPHAEVLLAVTMTLSATARYVGLVQLVALLVAVAATLGIALRIGVPRRPAVLAALAFATLPIVALQASTALNDIVVAAFVAAAAFFLLRTSRHDLVLAALATALLLGTKVTGILALPGLLLVAAVAHRGRSALLPIGAVAGGAVAGSAWYAANLARTGDVFGGFGDEQRGGTDPVEWLGRFTRLALNAIELPGAVGRDRLLYVAAAIMVAGVGLALARGRAGRAVALGAAGLTLVPLLLPPLERGLARVQQKAWYELGRPELGNLDPGRDVTKAGTLYTWYGPVGLLLTVAAIAVVVSRVRARQAPPVALVLAVAPVLWVAAIAVAVTYFEWNGRFAMGGVVLAAATWGVVLERRMIAWAVVAVSAVSVGLALVHYDEKPSGLRLLEQTGRASVWGAPRYEVQGIVPSLGELIRLTDERVREDAAIGIWPSPFPEDPGRRGIQLLPFPLFGSELGRQLSYVRDLAAAERAGSDWAVLPDDAETLCRQGWVVAFRAEPRWVVFRRAPGAACSR